MKYQINTDRKALFNKFFPVFVLLATIILGAIFWSYFMFEVDNDIKNGEMRHQSILQIQAKELSSSIENQFMDLLEIASRPNISNYIEQRRTTEKIIDEFTTYLKRKRNYNRINILVPGQKKLFQVDYTNDTIQSRTLTQVDLNKNGRNRKIEELFQHKYSISKIKPLLQSEDKPQHFAIALATTIENETKEKAILSLSSSFDITLKKMRRDKQILFDNQKVLGRTFIIDHHGIKVYDIDNVKQYCTHDSISTCTFLKSYLKQKDRFDKTESGSFISKKGFFSFTTINFGAILEQLLKENHYQYDKKNLPYDIEYKIVSYIPEDSYKLYGSQRISRLIVIYLVILFLLIIISYLSATALSNKIYNQILLRKSSKKLKEANNAKDKFIKILAHDLKNPIMSIQGFSTIIHEDDPAFSKEQKNNYARLILQSTKGMLQLIDEVLTWSKSQNGDLKINSEKISVNETIDKALNLIGLQAIKKEITILKDLEENLYINTDRNMFITVIRNLTSNAIKFSHRGKYIKIESLRNGNMCEIRIKDNGVGISEKQLKKIFEIGEKTHTKGTENEKGTGLGLVLCKEFIDKNNGEITIDSQIDRGTTITLIFPLYL